ncbi:MAG: hypothetical protein WAV15_02355 [Minisyncoccia bacterium]
MKNMKISFLKRFATSALVVLFGLVLGFSSTLSTPANAQVVMVTGSITASPGTICPGESSNISWATTDATSISITGIGSGLPAYGDEDVSPTQTTKYTMTLSNSTGGYGQTSATVYVSNDDACSGGGDEVPTVNLTAADNTLNPGQTTTLSWTVTNNPTSCTATGAWSGSKDEDGGSETVGPISSSRTYTISCSNNAGFDTDSETLTLNDDQGTAPTVSIRADDTRIDEGDETTIHWSSSRADYCTASEGRNGWAGNQNRSGDFDTDDLTRDTTYRITCYNQFGSATDSVTVRIDEDNNNNDEPTVNIYANPSSVISGGSSTITWTSQDADSCRSTGGTGNWSSSNRGRSGTFYANSLTRDTTFNITCKNDEGSSSDSATVRVVNVVNNTQPTVLIYADSTNISYNSATFIRWSTANATSCFASGGSLGWPGTKSIGPGSFYTGSLTSSRTYTITCSSGSGSATDSVTVNVRPRTITTTRPSPTSLVLVTSSIDRNQPILPTLDNTRPRVGDEINYTVTYQNIGTGSISNLNLRLDLPYEVTYMFSNPNNPVISGNTLIFSLGTLRANGTGTVTVRVRVREDAAPGALLNFPAVLSYTDPSGFPQSVTANVSAQVWSNPVQEFPEFEERTIVPLGAGIFGAGFWPTSLFGWLLFIILILVLILLARSLFAGSAAPAPWTRKTTTTVQH